MLFNEFHRLIETGDLLDAAGISEERGEQIAAHLPAEIKVREVIGSFDPGRPATRHSPSEPRDWHLDGDEREVATEVIKSLIDSCPALTIDEAVRFYEAVKDLETKWRNEAAEEAILHHIYGEGGAKVEGEVYLAGY
jgi:hypothetical protein